MDIFTKIVDFFGGSAVKTIADTIMAYLPPDISPEKKIEIAFASSQQEYQRQKDAMIMAHEMDKEFNQRIKDLEGTAADLKALPYVGNILIFFRGAQRPIWGFATLYLDYMWFSNAWKIPDGTQQSAAFLVINVLVLAFLFGERALQNVMPYIIQFFGAKAK